MTQGRRSPAETLALVREPPTTAELLANGYERWFDPLHAYVSLHVTGRHVRVRIVREVLSENLDLLVGRREEGLEISRLKRTANRLIAELLTGEDVDRRRLYGPKEWTASVPAAHQRPR